MLYTKEEEDESKDEDKMTVVHDADQKSLLEIAADIQRLSEATKSGRVAPEVARGFLDLYDSADVEAIVTPSGSCGAMVHHYDELFADDPRELAEKPSPKR